MRDLAFIPRGNFDQGITCKASKKDGDAVFRRNITVLKFGDAFAGHCRVMYAYPTDIVLRCSTVHGGLQSQMGPWHFP